MIDQALLTEQEREFCGLFAGEGCIHLVRQKRRDIRWYSFSVRLSVAQRMDNLGLLLWLRDNFGGRIVGRRHDKRGTWSATWQLATKADVVRMLLVLLQSSIPSTKHAQARLALEFMETTHPPGRCGWGHTDAYTEQERSARISMYEQMKAMKRFDHTAALAYAEGPIQ
jgi:hypothetical protein